MNCLDIWKSVTDYLGLKDIKHLVILSKQFYGLQRIIFNRFYFNVIYFKEISSEKAIFIRNICNIFNFELLENFPNVCKIILHDECGNINVDISRLRITHLTFGRKFNNNIKSVIPASVTHLTFGWDFNQDIKSAIPAS